MVGYGFRSASSGLTVGRVRWGLEVGRVPVSLPFPDSRSCQIQLHYSRRPVRIQVLYLPKIRPRFHRTQGSIVERRPDLIIMWNAVVALVNHLSHRRVQRAYFRHCPSSHGDELIDALRASVMSAQTVWQRVKCSQAWYVSWIDADA